jgi:ABC-2 type transport system ATP-binding protein
MASNGTAPAIEARDLSRTFKGGIEAVREVDLNIGPGEVFGFLGPNGAGKSTTVRMLCTLLPPTGGSATVAGHDVVSDGDAVRSSIGVALQEIGLDPVQTGRELLELQCGLYGITGGAGRARVAELLDLVGLTEAADRRTKTYSGGMKRRLDLASALVHRPRVLFLDEPTTGLDPQARMAVWDLVNGLRAEGLGIVLTTHYMDEAERLSDALTVLAQGRVVAQGTPKSVLGDMLGEHVVVFESESASAPAVTAWLDARGLGAPLAVLGSGHVPLSAEQLADFARAFPALRYEVRPPNLDDLFLKLAVDTCAG